MKKAFREVIGTECEIDKKRSFADWKKRRPDIYETYYINDTFFAFNTYHELWLNKHEYDLSDYKKYGMIWQSGQLLRSASNLPI